MPLLANGNGRSLGPKPGTSKIKSSLASSLHSDSEFHLVNRKKKGKSSNGNHGNPTSLSLQHIIDNHPILNINEECYFPYDNAMITDPNALLDNNSAIDNESCNSLKPRSHTPNDSRSPSHTILPGTTHTKPNFDQYLKLFKSNFNGSLVIIIELTNSNISTGS